MKRAGRTLPHRNVELELPENLALPECSNCGARPLAMKQVAQLTPMLEELFEARLTNVAATAIDALAEERPLYEWETLLGLSGGYLSKLRGSKTPSSPLVLLLHLLANDPERAKEIERMWRGPRRAGPRRTAAT